MANQRTILISDDVNIFLEMEKSLFRRHDIGLLVAHSGVEALELIERERPDLVLLDLNLEGMDGDEVCRRTKEHAELQDIPFVLMPLANWDEEVRRCRLAQCDAVVYKPINRSHLLKTTRELLGIADRSSHRMASDVNAYIGVEAGESISALCLDLSTGGAFIKSRVVFPMGTSLRILLNPPEWEKSIRCRGRIAWVNSPGKPVKPTFPMGFGVQFIEMGEDTEEEISQLLDKLETGEAAGE
jgi:CheY-like chemotaxis protein/Tfp pilus assembly protein PilZ